MFDDVLLVFVPRESLRALQSCAVPVLRRHQHDDILPDLPEEAELLPQYTLHRPAAAWFAEGAAGAADAADAFTGTQQHEGLVITASRCIKQHPMHAGVLRVHSTSRFPWHPTCQYIAARGCSVSPAELRAAAERCKKQGLVQQQRLQQQPELQQCGDCKWWPSELVPVPLIDEQLFLQDLATAIRSHNTSIFTLQQEQRLAGCQQQKQALIVPLLLDTVRRTAAAVAVQSAWRAHRSRISHCIADRLLHKRAACAIQRAWRAYVLRSRLAMLAAAAAAYHHAQTQLRFSCIMCLDVAALQLMEAAAERCRRGSAVFPEHRLWYVVEPEQGDLFLLELPEHCTSSSEGSWAGDSSSNSQCAGGNGRPGLPTWLGAGVPTIPAECSAAQSALSRAHVAQLLQLCCSIKDLLDPSQIALGRCSAQDVAQLVTFRSKQQAAQRAALLAVFTFDMRSRQYARLMTVQESPLGAAYRSLTGIGVTTTTTTATTATTTSSSGSSTNTNTTQAEVANHGRAQLISSVAVAVAASAAGHSSIKPRSRAAHARGGDTGKATAAVQARPAGIRAKAAAAGGCGVPVSAAAAPAAAGAVPALAQDSMPHNSPRMAGFAVPLQPIRPTDTLLAAVTAEPGLVQAGGLTRQQPSKQALPASAANTLQFHISVLSRLPYLLKELAAAEAASLAVNSEHVPVGTECAGTGQPAPQPASAATAACSADQRACCSSGADDCCITSQPPAAVAATPGISSIGAVLEDIKHPQVDAFKRKLAADAEAADAAAAADSIAKHEEVAAAKAAAGAATSSGAACLSTSNCVAPHYWPNTTAGATAAAQAVRQQSQAAAATRVTALQQQQQLAAGDALRTQQRLADSMRAAARAGKQGRWRRLQQQAASQQAAAHSRVEALRHVRAAAPAARHGRQQQALVFVTRCNELSKHMRKHTAQASRTAERTLAAQHAAQHAAQQRHAEQLAAAALQERRHDQLCAAQGAVMLSKLQAEADLAAVMAIQELELAAKRAAVAARHVAPGTT